MENKIYKIIGIIFLVIALGIIIIMGGKSYTSFKTIGYEEAYKMMKKDVLILDVRTKEEYEQGHIKNSINVPLNKIAFFNEKKDKTILVYCQSGNRSREGSKQLLSMGYKKVYNIGGIDGWPYEIVK